MSTSPPLPAATADAIRQTARDVLARPEYQLEPPPSGGRELFELLLRILAWLLSPFRWLFDSMEGLPEALRWIIVVGLTLLLLALVGHMIYTILAVVRPIARKRGAVAANASPEQRADDFERMSHEAATQRDYIGAVRCLFRATLLRLQARENRSLRPGVTNREVLARYRDAPFIDAMRLFVETIDSGWYGQQPCREGEYRRCNDAYQRIRLQTQAPADHA